MCVFLCGSDQLTKDIKSDVPNDGDNDISNVANSNNEYLLNLIHLNLVFFVDLKSQYASSLPVCTMERESIVVGGGETELLNLNNYYLPFSLNITNLNPNFNNRFDGNYQNSSFLLNNCNYNNNYVYDLNFKTQGNFNTNENLHVNSSVPSSKIKEDKKKKKIKKSKKTSVLNDAKNENDITNSSNLNFDIKGVELMKDASILKSVTIENEAVVEKAIYSESFSKNSSLKEINSNNTKTTDSSNGQSCKFKKNCDLDCSISSSKSLFDKDLKESDDDFQFINKSDINVEEIKQSFVEVMDF